MREFRYTARQGLPTHLLLDLVGRDQAELPGRPRADPRIVEEAVVQRHDGLDAGPVRRAGGDPEPAVRVHRRDIRMNKANAIRRRQRRRIQILAPDRILRRQAMQEVRMSAHFLIKGPRRTRGQRTSRAARAA